MANRSVKGRGAPGGAPGDAKRPRGYLVDYRNLKTLCRQAGLKLVDLYEPGILRRQVISEGTLKKWRRGGRASSEALLRVAEALSERLHWQLDWRELIESAVKNVSLNYRLAVVPFHAVANDHAAGGCADGFRATILAHLSKLRDLQVVSLLTPDTETIPLVHDADDAIDVVLRAALRAHGERHRLDLELTNVKTRELLWVGTYPFSADDPLRAQIAIAAEVADQIARTLAS